MEDLNIGSVNISDEVVSIIAGIAASEVDGIIGMSGSFTSGISEFLGKKDPSKGIKVEVNEGVAVISLSVIVRFGVKIPDVAWEVQNRVKQAVESQTGMTVSSVNVTADGIMNPKPEKKAKPELIAEDNVE